MSIEAKKKLSKLFTFLVVIFPVLSVYRSPIPSVELGTFLLILLYGILLMKTGSKNVALNSGNHFWSIIVYVFFCTLIAFVRGTILYSSSFSIFFRFGRFSLLMTGLILFGRVYFDIEYGLLLLKKLTLWISVYVLIQTIVFSITGFKLPNAIQGLTKLDITISTSLRQYEVVYRPPGIFLEPSSFCYFVAPYLCYCMFEDSKWDKKRVRDFLTLSAAILCTTSGQGCLMLLTLIGAWIFMRTTVSRTVKYIFVLPAAIAVIFLLSKVSFIQYAVNRVFTSNYNAVEARSTGYTFFNSMPLLTQILGAGYGNYPENLYFSGFADILMTTGYVGLVLVLLYYLRCFLSGGSSEKMLSLVSLILMAGGGIYTATYLCLYMPFLSQKQNSGRLATI